MSRPSLLLLHGFLGSPADWGPLALEHHVDCLAPALPGHGVPPAPWPGAAGDWRALLEELANRLESLPRPRFLAGYSLGGRLALALAVTRPSILDGLLLLASSPGLEGEPDREQRRRLDHERSRALVADFPAFLEAWYHQPLFGRITDLPCWPALRAKRLGGQPGALAEALEAFSPGRLPAIGQSALARLDRPVLVLTGAGDEAYRVVGDRLARALPRATRRELPAAHALLEEAPEACAREMLTFIAVHTNPANEPNTVRIPNDSNPLVQHGQSGGSDAPQRWPEERDTPIRSPMDPPEADPEER